MKVKRVLSLLLIVCLLLSAAACGKTEPAVTEPEREEVQSHFPVELTDQAGRRVVIEREPERLVSAYYISTSALMALGLQDRIVGVENKPEKRPLYGLSAPQLLELPTVGTAKEFNLEGCIALEPDLVILPVRLKTAAESLEQLGIDVLLINPESLPQLMEALELIAAAADTDRVQALASFAEEQEKMLEGISGTRPTVYMAGNSAMLSTAGAKMYQSDMISLAGGENAAAEIPDDYWVEISYEQLLTWDPDYILLASDATYSVEDVLSDPNLAACKAVKDGNVIRMPGKAEAWDSPVPGGILGSVWLASVLHGDQVTPERAAEIIDAYYREFYGFTYSEK